MNDVCSQHPLPSLTQQPYIYIYIKETTVPGDVVVVVARVFILKIDGTRRACVRAKKGGGN